MIMKTKIFRTTFIAIVGLVLTSIGSPQAATITLFEDTFDRADNTNLNAVSTGKSGTLGALDWVEVKSAGEPTITSNTLRLGETTGTTTSGGGGGWSIAYVDHNFTDATITSGGEFTVSVDLVGSISSGGNTRFNGFAVGHSLAEVSGWSANTPASFASDFFFGYDPTGTTEVKIFTSGSQVHQRTVDLGAGAELSVRFTLSDFNTGSTVNYEAFVNGASEDTGSFTWSGTNENYLALYSNYTAMNGKLDNFSVSTVPEPSSQVLMGLAAVVLCALRRRSS